MPKLTAIFFTAYMLAVMWTFRAHGQAPDEQPVANESQTLPRVELPADEPTYKLPAATPQREARVEDLAHIPRWMVVGGSVLMTSAAMHMALWGRLARCHGEDRRFVTPFITGGITMSVGAVLAILGATRWARVEKPLPATRSERTTLGLGSLGLIAYSQLGLSVLALPEFVSCAVNSNS